jgi:hypothetical protein
MNHSNKDGTSPAESGEGRPLIKENADQPNTYSTQSGKGVSQGLAGVRKAAKNNKEMKFTALLHHLTVDLLRESFYSLKRKAAPGVDGVTWQEYENGLEDRLTDLHDRVHRGAYRAIPCQTGQWLKSVVQGHFNYYAVPGNLDSLGVFRERVIGHWGHTLRRRSQQRPISWERILALAQRWLPQPRVLHPYPAVRFAASHPR